MSSATSDNQLTLEFAGATIASTTGNSVTLNLPTTTPPVTPKTSKTGAIVPFYTYPGNVSWVALQTAAIQYPGVTILAIVNPNNGPLAATTQAAIDYIKAMKAIQAACANVKFLGYCDTNGENTLYPLATVEDDVNEYLSWGAGLFYGMFFDDFVFNNLTFVKGLASFVKGLSLYSVGNPGTTLPNAGYAGLLDNYTIYENGPVAIPPTPTMIATQAAGLTPAQSSMMVFGLPSWTSTVATQVAAIAPLVAWMYIGNAVGGTAGPYDTASVCDYLAQTLQVLASL